MQIRTTISKGALYCEVNLYNTGETTPYEQALDKNGKAKLLIGRHLWQNQAQEGAGIQFLL